MNNYPKWADVRDDLVARAGGEDQVTKARKRNQTAIDGHRLAERRKALDLTQPDIAEQA